MNGKNRAQRLRLASAFSRFRWPIWPGTVTGPATPKTPGRGGPWPPRP